MTRSGYEGCYTVLDLLGRALPLPLVKKTKAKIAVKVLDGIGTVRGGPQRQKTAAPHAASSPLPL